MDWYKISITTTSEGVEPVTGRMMNIGITGFEITDPNDFEDFLEHKDGNWDYVDDDLYELRNAETRVSFYLPDNAQGKDMFDLVRSEMAALSAIDDRKAFGTLAVSEPQGMNEEDWANNWKKYFKPFEVGTRLAVKPSWEEYSSADRKILEIDPESSFGTGQHNTTRLCLEYLDKIVKGGEKVLDLGCGSGILSIAALLLGVDSAVAVDIDENSVRIARENAGKNKVDDRYTAYAGNILTDSALADKLGGGYDIITANIVADVLIAMAPLFGKFLSDDGILIVSGIILPRADEVTDALTNSGFSVKSISQSDDWAAVELCRK